MLKVFERNVNQEFLVSEDARIYSRNRTTGELRLKKQTLNKKRGYYYVRTQQQYNRLERLVKSGLSYRKAGREVGMPYSTVAHFMRGSRGVKSNAN